MPCLIDPIACTRTNTPICAPTLSLRAYACVQVRGPQARAVFRDRGYGDVGALDYGVLTDEQAQEHVEGNFCFLCFLRESFCCGIKGRQSDDTSNNSSLMTDASLPKSTSVDGPACLFRGVGITMGWSARSRALQVLVLFRAHLFFSRTIATMLEPPHQRLFSLGACP